MRRLSCPPQRIVSWSLIAALVITITLGGSVPADADDPIGSTRQPTELPDCGTPPVRPTIWSAMDWHNDPSNTHCKMNMSDQRAGHTGVWGRSGNYWVQEYYIDPTPTATVNSGGTNFRCYRVFIREIPQVGPTADGGGNFGGTMTGTRLQVWSASGNITFATTRSWGRYRPGGESGWWVAYLTSTASQPAAVGGRWGANGSLEGAEEFAVTVYGLGTVPAGYAPRGVDPASISSPTGTSFPNGDAGDRTRNDLCVAASAPPAFQPNEFGADKPHTFGMPSGAAFSKDPVNLATGVFTSNSEDLVLPGRVLGLTFVRWYNSADPTTGPLGPAWTHTFNWTLTDAGSTVEVRQGDGRRDTFARNPDGTYANPPDLFDVLVKNADASYTLTLANQTRYEFSVAGQLTRIHEPAGNAVTLNYTSGNLTTLTDTVGRAVTLTYDAADRLTQLQDPLGRLVTYAYDAEGRLATVTDRIGNAPGGDPAQHRWQYAYDGATQHLTTITDPDGRVRVTNTYDDQGRVVEQRDGLNELTTILYATLETTVADPRGHQTTYTFDSRMRVLSQTDVVGSRTYTVSYTYDAVGNRTSVTDREGKTTDLTYDERGNVLTKTDPSPNGVGPRPMTTFEYDSRNNLTEITDANGAVTTLSYDPITNVLLSVSRQVDGTTTATTSYEYADPANPGLPTRIYSPRGNATGTPDPTYSTVLAYDSEANLVSRTDADGATTTFQYDGLGRLVSFVDPDGNAPGGVPTEHSWAIEYDALDRESQRADPLGNVLRYAYDGAGNRTALTDRNGNVTTYAYDGNARLVAVTQKSDPGGPTTYVTAVERDGNGNATRVTQANGVVTDYAFDALDRLTSVTTHPDAATNLATTYVLDGTGQPTSRTTGDGVTVNYIYDGLGRLNSVTGPSLSVTYAYDAAGNRTQMVDATGTTTYQYDGLGRVTQIAAPSGALSYAYDLDGNRTTLGYPGGQSVTYEFSPGGRMTTVTDWASRISRYTYQPSGLVATLDYPDGLRATYAYDRAQRLTQLTNAVGATTISQHTYTLDPEGNRTTLDEYVQGITQPPIVWSDSVRVNDDAGATQQDRPAIALGSDAATYLIWDDFRSGSHADIYFSRRDPTTGAWSANQKVNDDATTRTQFNAALAVDPSNNAYAAWQDQRDGNKTPDTNIYASKRSASTGAWGANVRVNDDTQGTSSQTEPRIAAGADGSAHAIWVDGRDRETNIYSSRLLSGAMTWTANTKVSSNGTSRKRAPDIAYRGNIGNQMDGYAVWEDDRSGDFDIYFNQFDCNWPPPDPSGCIWNGTDSPISDDTTGAAQYSARIVLAASEPVAFWLDDRGGATHIRFKRVSQGGASQVIGDPSAVPVSLAVSAASDGRMFVVWQDARGTSYDLWGTEYDPATGTWSTPIRVDDDPASTAQLRPTVAVNDTEVAAAWRDDRTGDADIRARRRAALGQGVDHFAYSYDGLNRLTGVTGPVAESFTFDAATNLATRSGPSATYAYDQANRVTSDGTRSFVWDGADRLTQRGADSFSYDPLARLISATTGSGSSTYAYNGDGLLQLRTDAAGMTTFVWDTSVAPAPLLEAGTDRVVHGLGPLYIARADGSNIRLVRDALGNVRAEVDDLGLVAKSFRYAAYGAISNRFSSEAMPTLLGFTGELADPSGLTYLRARWYDPSSGRFLTHDPHPGLAVSPGTLNAFTYVGGNPTTYSDPSGRFCIPCGAIAIAAARGAASGFLSYSVGVVLANSASGKEPLSGWDLREALVATGVGAATGGVGVMQSVAKSLAMQGVTSMGFAGVGQLAANVVTGRSMGGEVFLAGALGYAAPALRIPGLRNSAGAFAIGLVAGGILDAGQRLVTSAVGAAVHLDLGVCACVPNAQGGRAGPAHGK